MATFPWPGVIRLPAILLVLCAAPAMLQAREFRVADTQAENYPTVQALMFAGRLLAARSGGHHSLRVFHSHQLGEEKETIEQTRVGAIDLNRTNVAPLGSIVPVANVLAMPFLFRSVDHLHKVLDGPIGDEILDSFRPHGFIGLTFYDSGARSLYNSLRPVRTIADMRGLRIRVQQSDLMVSMVKALGATPIALPYGQVTTGLTTNRRRREQLAVFRYHQSLQVRAILHPDRTHHEPRSADHVDQGVGESVAAGPRALSRGRARVESLHAEAMAGLGKEVA
jgi:TRAP-type C4-dicarboxylate transport system substrate-binding protein